MLYRTLIPPAPLDSLIENIWYWEGDAPAHRKDTIMASGRMALLVNLRDDRLSRYGGAGFARETTIRGIGICGAYSHAFAIDAHQPHMMGVQFAPGGATPFLKIPARDVADMDLSLEDVWGAAAHRLHVRLIETPTPEGKIVVLLQALLERADEALERDPLVSQALTMLSDVRCRSSLSGIARDMGVSDKKFISVFASQVGHTPKLYRRVRRFQRLLEHAWKAQDEVDWSELAPRFGYYDQSHLIRDFRQFSGFTPATYLRLRGPYLQHVPLRA